jgi:hypothetical protein
VGVRGLSTPMLYSSLSLLMRVSKFLHLHLLLGVASPWFTASTDTSELACSSFRLLRNFHMDGWRTVDQFRLKFEL